MQRGSRVIHARIKGIDPMLETSEELFSPSSIDEDTLAMLSVVDFKRGDRVLDLGCGYGIVGILAAKIVGAGNVVMIYPDGRAIELSRANALTNSVPGIRSYQSDGFNNVEIALVQPPVPDRFLIAQEPRRPDTFLIGRRENRRENLSAQS